MTETSYTYSVIRYVHDLAAGECLNIGVVLHCADKGYVGIRYNRSARRLSSCFSDFQVYLYHEVLRDLEKSIDSLNHQSVLFPLKDALEIVNFVWPDFALNYRGTAAAPGVARESLEDTLDKLYLRFVESQAPTKHELKSRSDDDVWTVFRNKVEDRRILQKLRPEAIKTKSVQFKFDHAYKNGKIHVVAPLSFDLIEADSIRDKAIRWIGNGEVLHDVHELGTFFFLVGRPRLKERLSAYETAMEWLKSVKLKKEIFFEDEPGALIDGLNALGLTSQTSGRLA